MMEFTQLERNGWILQCPSCGNDIRYTLITHLELPVPFFYADNCNDVLLRKQDQRRVEQLYAEYGDQEPPDSALASLWNSILSNAPEASCGGKFGFWSNVKCPVCGKEFPYAQGTRNVRFRVFESKVVLIDGATIIGDSATESWRIRVTLDSNS
jgi:endogenous inhibitor of DNA gyrase (YacG/DUF329 family)